ncbi:MAG: MFS transporter, partial [Spirillospora sp.]
AALFTATAAPAVGGRRHGRALAVVATGPTLALALGVPLGTAIGSALDWRATLWTVTALSVIALPLLAVRLPDVWRPQASLREQLDPLTDRRGSASAGDHRGGVRRRLHPLHLH